VPSKEETSSACSIRKKKTIDNAQEAKYHVPRLDFSKLDVVI